MDLIKRISVCFIIGGVFFLASSQVYAQDTDSTYTVKEGDFLVKIATSFGNPNFWEPIYEANNDQIADVDLIYPGQIFKIPATVFSSPKFISDTKSDSVSAEKKTSPEEYQLEEFRKAFAELINQQKAIEKVKEQKKSVQKTNGLEFGGLVINETRSKMGDDFFNVFYQYWEAPKNSGNFILKITEQPVPSLGTMVSVEIDEQQIYKSRLQPRYTVIENMAKQAVMISYQTIQQRMQNSNDISIY